MPNPNSNLMARFSALPNDSTEKILIVTIVVSLFCSVMVSSAAVLLRPLQEADAALAMKRDILKVAGLYQEGGNINALFSQVDIRIVDLDTGQYAEHINAESFDYKSAARDPELSIEIPDDQDIARINRRARYAPVYVIADDNDVTKIVFPVHGAGLWSTLYAFVALNADGNTVEGILFYRHGETPGLGDEITDPDWQAQWQGQRLFDDSGAVRLRVVRGTAGRSSADAHHQIDGISGATLTGNGVTNLIQFWFGDLGFGPYLERLRVQGA